MVGDTDSVSSATPVNDVPEAEGEAAWAMVEASPDALVMADEHGVIKLVNRQAEALFGYDRAELLGRPVELLLPERFSEIHAAHRNRFRAAPAVRTMGNDLDLLARKADGSEIPVEVSLSPLQIDGELRVIAAVRDISDRVAAKELLAKSEAQFRSAFRDGPVPMSLTEVSPTADRIIRQTNQAMADLLGYSIDELIGMSFADITHPADREADDAGTAAQASAVEDTFTARKRYLRKNGSTVWVHLHVSTLQRDDDRIMTIGHALDISAELESDRARRHQEGLSDALSSVRLAMLEGATRADGLAMVCALAAQCLNAGPTVVLTPGPSGADELLIEASANLTPENLEKLSFRKNEGIAGEVLRTGVAEVSSSSDPRIAPSQRAVAEQSTTVAVAPLSQDGEVSGLLVLTSKPNIDDSLGEADLRAIQDFALAAGVAIEIAASRQTQNTLELLEDRERIGRDMHDKVIGRLFATGMSLQSTLGITTDLGTSERLKRAVSEIDDAIKEIRTAIYGVRAQADWGKGVRGRILAIAADQNDIIGFEPNVQLSGPINSLPESIVEEMLSTLREALTNIAKYAHATSITIGVQANSEGVHLTVTDDGVGFDQSLPTEADGLTNNGLLNMETRARDLGGNASIDSEVGRGTTVHWTAPTTG